MPESLALADGQTIFIPGVRRPVFFQKNSYLRVRGFIVHSARGERNGVTGSYYWADRSDTHDD